MLAEVRGAGQIAPLRRLHRERASVFGANQGAPTLLHWGLANGAMVA